MTKNKGKEFLIRCNVSNMGKKYRLQVSTSDGVALVRIVDENGKSVKADFTTSSAVPIDVLDWESLEGKKSMFDRLKPNRLRVNLGIVEAVWEIKSE